MVVQGQHFVIALLLDQEQRQVPPVVRDHEGVKARPGATDLAHEINALLHTALGQHDVGERVMRPRLLAAQGDGVARRCLCPFEEMALLPGKGRHAVQVRHVGRRRQRGQRHAQHAG